jgi:tetratricopeptide (TPR) repeat protein
MGEDNTLNLEVLISQKVSSIISEEQSRDSSQCINQRTDIKNKDPLVKIILDEADDLSKKCMWMLAIKGYEDVLKKGGEDEKIYRKMSYCYLHLNDFDMAIRMDNRALLINPDYLDPYVGLIVAYAHKNDVEEVLFTFKKYESKCVKHSPRREALFHVGWVLYNAGKFSEAKEYLDRMDLNNWNTTKTYWNHLKSKAIEMLKEINSK